MAFYADEDDAWKCLEHPSKRRSTGICPICLRDRLISLCPDCANARPCACCASASSSSSSSSSSSFSLFSSSRRVARDTSWSDRVGSVGRVSSLIETEPAFRRSRSVAAPFLYPRLAGDPDSGGSKPASPGIRSKWTLWSVFKTQKSKKHEEWREGEEVANKKEVEAVEQQMVTMRSRSVRVPAVSDSGVGNTKSSPAVKSWGWYFPSPIKVFRQSKTSKVVQERSPLHRG